MALNYTPTVLESGFGSIDILNENFTNIDTAFNDAVSRSGNTPNAMLADFDMNSFRILNVGQAIQAGDAVPFGQLAALAGSGDLAVNGFVNGVATAGGAEVGQTDVDLSGVVPGWVPGSGSLLVFVDGVLQTSGYTENSDQSITFDTPLTGGEIVSVILLNTTGVTSVATTIYDVAFTYQGRPGVSSELVVAIPRACTLVAGAPNSVGRAEVAATGSTAFDLQRNGTSVGTITFGAAATSANFTVASTVAFSAGDRISITSPDPQDDTLADVGITLVLRID
jgi:hypothetical protein